MSYINTWLYIMILHDMILHDMILHVIHIIHRLFIFTQIVQIVLLRTGESL